MRVAKRKRGESSGATMVEYALLIAMIAIICLGAISAVGRQISNRFSEEGSYLD